MVICFDVILHLNAWNTTRAKVGTPEIFDIIIYSAQSAPVPSTQWELNKYKWMMTMITSLRHTHRLTNQLLSPYAF